VIETTVDGAWKDELATQIATGQISTVVAIGGDGTLMEVARWLYEARSKVPLFAVPAGRGNDFVRGLHGFAWNDGQSGDFWDWCAKHQSGWSKGTLDLASADGRVFLNMASIGYGGRIVEKVNTRKAFWSKSPLVYQIEGAIALLDSGESKVEVKVNGKSEFIGEFFGAFVGNGRANGAGLYWTSDARFDDGRLDLITFQRPGVFEMAKALNEVKAQRKPPFRHQRFQSEELSLHFDQPTALELDGDYVGQFTQCGFKCLPKAFTAWVLKK
jgi:diacylglycerol kinase family enzyme